MSKLKSAEEVVDIIQMSDDDESNRSDSSPVKRKVGDPPCSIPMVKSSRKRPTEEELDSDYVESDPSSTDNENEGEITCTENDQDADVSGPSKKSPKRWRRADKTNWKRSISTTKRASGQGFVNESGQEKPGREIREYICNHASGKAILKCHTLTPEQRKEFFDSYWSKGVDFIAKKNFLLQFTKKVEAQRHRIEISENQTSRKKMSTSYFVPINGENVQVCEKFFRKTLDISFKPIAKAHENKTTTNQYSSVDNRGKHPPKNKLPESSHQAIVDHIKSFPCIESHYTRKNTQKQYLGSRLNITKMYELYQEKYKDSGIRMASFQTFQNVFGTEFNLGFQLPKNDQCLKCGVFKRAEAENPNQTAQEEYKAHLERKERCREAMKKDIESTKENPELVVASFDLQSVLQIPVSAESSFFYKRKLCLYNLTFFCENTKDAYCFTWPETEGRRGSNEIGSCIYYFIQEMLKQKKTQIKLWSDCCGGQNRNHFVSTLLNFLVQKEPQLQFVEQSFLESGHTQISVDSMHSAIEAASKHLSIYSVNEWINIMKQARRRNLYKIVRLNHPDFFDLKKLSSITVNAMKTDTNQNKVNWLTLKQMRYEKVCPGVIKYKLLHDSEFLEIDTSIRRSRGRPMTIGNLSLPKLYDSALPISESKKKDLLNLCTTGLIPTECRLFFESLPVSSEMRNSEYEEEEDE